MAGHQGQSQYRFGRRASGKPDPWHMIISELNMLLLAKCEMYNIDGFTKSNIDIFIKLIATD